MECIDPHEPTFVGDVAMEIAHFFLDDSEADGIVACEAYDNTCYIQFINGQKFAIEVRPTRPGEYT